MPGGRRREERDRKRKYTPAPVGHRWVNLVEKLGLTASMCLCTELSGKIQGKDSKGDGRDRRPRSLAFYPIGSLIRFLTAVSSLGP